MVDCHREHNHEYIWCFLYYHHNYHNYHHYASCSNTPSPFSPPYRISTLHLPFQSKWLYLGTERGNIHIVNIETFTLSGYTINWNKAIEL